MLHSRVVGFRPELFDALAYDDRLFFDWGGWLAVRPMAELPYWRTLMRRNRDQPKLVGLVEQHGKEITAMRSLLAERGTLCSRDFDAADRRAIVSYRGTKDSSLVLYYLWLVGDAMTHHRDGFERVYAPTDAVAPAHLICEAGEADTDRFMARKAVAFAGIGKPGPLSRTLARRVTRDEERAIEHALVDSGELVPVEVEGWSGRRFVVGSDVDLLRDVASGRVPDAWTPVETTTDEEVVLLSPLDPVLERRRAKTLFDFDYVWEIYKKPELVKFGRLRDAHPLGRPLRRAHRPQNRSPVEDARRQRRLARRPRARAVGGVPGHAQDGAATTARVPRHRPGRRDRGHRHAGAARDHLTERQA